MSVKLISISNPVETDGVKNAEDCKNIFIEQCPKLLEALKWNNS